MLEFKAKAKITSITIKGSYEEISHKSARFYKRYRILYFFVYKNK